MNYLSAMVDGLIKTNAGRHEHLLPINHNGTNYIIRLAINWPDLNKKTQNDLIEYFKLCIDTKTYKGILTIKA